MGQRLEIGELAGRFARILKTALVHNLGKGRVCPLVDGVIA